MQERQRAIEDDETDKRLDETVCPEEDRAGHVPDGFEADGGTEPHWEAVWVL